jgi:hypothetical protein
MPSPETITPEEAVRAYLRFLEDPTSVVDAAAVKQAQSAVDSATDPIARLKALSALERAQATDETVYRNDFVRYARTWAQEEGIPASAFRELGVPKDVLAEAGLDGPPRRDGRRRRGGAGTGPRGTAPRQRRPAVKTEALQEAILGMAEPFTVKDIVENVGGSPMTVKAVLERLIAQEKVTDVGERPAARGRAAKLWKVV